MRDLVLVDLDAEARPLDPAPVRAVHDRDALGQDVVGHHLGGLLVAAVGVGRRQHHVLAGRGGEAELAMGVLADVWPS